MAAVPPLPRTAEEIFRQATRYKETGQLEEAIEEFLLALEQNPNYKEATYNLGNSYREQGNIKQAISYWRRTLEIDPKFKSAHVNLGIALRGIGELDDAISHHMIAIDLDDQCLEAYVNIGVALATRHERGDFTEAAIYYDKAIALDSKCKVAHFNKGLLLKASDDLDGAEAAFRLAIGIDPTDPLLRCHLGQLQLEINKQEEDRVTKLVENNNADPRNEPLTIKAVLDTDDIYRRCELAMAEFQEALTLNEDWKDAHVGVGLVHFSQGGLDEAFEVLSKVLTRWPEDLVAHRHVAEIHYRFGRTKDAIPHWEFVLEVDPSERRVRNLVGQACKRYGMVKGALHHYKQALLTDPDYEWWFRVVTPAKVPEEKSVTKPA